MKVYNKLGKKILALLLAVAMVCSYLPGMALNASAAEGVNKVADPSTMNDWENFFGPNKLSTEFAGGVWTDKSVFADASAFSGVTMDNENSFLVAMSAIAASKKVEGQSSSPTDTMLVLDLSNSMDTIGAIPDMVDAANASIAKLLGMNDYNRVGVVLYSGNSQQGNASSNTATVIMPLARYKANTQGKYLDYTGSTNNTWVTRADGMTYGDGTVVSGTDSKQTNGGTYIQNGLYKAWQEFEKVTDTTVSSGTMAGAKRTPIYILMSDGEPTVATTNYNSVGQSGIGDGTAPSNQTTRNQLTFLTQLTAAWAKGKAETKYGTDAKFYTLGLGISENESATAVLSPASTNTTVSGWWTNFLAGTAGEDVVIYRTNYWNSWSLYRDAAVAERNYVDMFKSADNADELPGLFEDIVAAIEEEAYNVTLVTGESENLSGYITFEDEVGELMEVRDVKGILLGSTLFSGAELAKSVDDGLFDGTTTATDYGREFIATIQERIGITDTSVAEQLLISAYREGQISYDDATGEYSNYIGWYTAADGSFISFWDEDYGMSAEAAPEGATYITKSYGYLGTSRSSDMMHVVVQVRTNIKTSHQTIVFKIPAALIPTVTYNVELDGTELEDASTLTREGAEPMRLLFEVGLRSDINAINMEQKVEEYLAADAEHHVHKNADGSYTFYSNSWGHGDGNQNPTYDEDLMDHVAESHFHPSYENERYYYTENTAIYVKNGDSYALYSGGQPSGDGYYHRRTVITASSNGGAASVGYIYAPIAAATLTADNLVQDGSNWYVKAGVPYTELARFDILKDGNTTNTLEYANYPLVVHDTAGFNIYAVLGNNGKITVKPAQGIKLSKTVTETSPEAGAPSAFEFTVTFDAQIAESEIELTDADGNAFTGTYAINSDSGKTVITVTLKDGEEVYITGIPANTVYEVYETQTIYYNSDKENDTVTGTVTANHIEDVTFTNAPRQYSQLTITKTVHHPFSSRPDALDNILFTFEVDLGAQAAGMTFPLADGTRTPAADENGVITMTIKAEQSITIQGLLEDTPYEVREINVPQGFSWDQAASSGLSGRIGGEAHLVNNYVPTPPVVNPDVDIVINKTLTGDYTEDETFTFLVEQLNPATNQYEVLGEKTVHVAWPATSTGTVSLSDIVTGFTTLGSHTFRITETAGSTVGMTYSNQISTFQVNVVDPEMDGVLTVEVLPLINTAVAEDNGKYTVTANFTNVYAVGSTYVDVNIHKNLINNTGVELSVTDFQFGLYTDPECTQLAQIVDGEHLTVYAGPLGNAVIRIPVTNIAQDGAVYYIREIVPATQVPGMTYSDAVYQVTLKVEAVEASGVATLAAEATVTLYAGNGQVEGNQVTFTNEFVLKAVSAEIKGNKSYIRGYDNTPIALAGGEFTFELWSANDDYTVNTKLGEVTNAADGSFVFSGLDALTYSKVGRYAYILREVTGNNSAVTYDPLDYYVLVIVTQGQGDALTATVRYRQEGATAGADQATFTNIYNVSGTAETVIRGHKTLTVTQGQKVLAGSDFTFGLYEGTDTSAAPIETVSNWANGNFVFKTLTYSAADVGKTFTYTVKEIVPATPNAGITYSQASFRVDVTIVDNGDGTIRAEQTITGGDAIAFENKYYAQPAHYTISGTKQLTGRGLKDGEFAFHLYQTGADFVVSGTPAQTTNAADGSFSFGTFTYTKAGTYYYVVREDIPGVDDEDRLGGVSYDAGVYQITVQVSDNGLGNLHASATVYRPGSTATSVVFRNGYTTEPATLILNAQKSYDKPMAGNDFTFKLEGDIDGTAVSQEKRNDATGKVVFDALTFEKEGTYTFQVTEIENVTSFPWIDFDPTVYTVTVTVSDNGAGEMVAEVKYTTPNDPDGTESIQFKNTYKIIEGAEVTLGGNKYYLGADLQPGQFEFGLYEDAACTQLIGQTVSNTVESIDLGKFVFPAIEYKDIHVDDLPATYTYYIKEILPAGIQEVDDGNGGKDYMLDGVFYDTSVYKVEVVLTDNNTGGVNVQTLVNGVENDEVAFTNAYNIVSGTQVVLQGNKIVHNKGIDAGKYTFGLYDVDGNELDTATNLADGTFKFDAITYDPDEDAGKDFTYTVKEIIPDGAVNNVYEGITYDTTVYTVTVEVRDDGQGGLQETVHITGGGTNNAIIFNNYYEITGNGSATIVGQKYYNNANSGAAMSVGAGDFSFGLFENNTLIATTTTAVGGAFQFQLSYGPADAGKTFTYEVREIAGEAGYITYDDTVYTVVVEVKDNGTGGIDVTKTVNGVADATAEFTNIYTNTGKANLTLSGVKKYFDTRLQQYVNAPVNGFTFLLKDDSGAVIRETRNVADGTFSFRALEYTADDIGKIYRYTIEERNDGLAYIGYDAKVYEVIVQVRDDGEGGIMLAKTVFDGGVSVSEVAFENTYTVSGDAELVLEGNKLYTNSLTGHLKDLPADTFKFNLSGNGINETVGNKAGGAFAFPALVYGVKDIGSTYTYTVSEVKGDLDYVIYDADVFTVTVTVSDNGKGGIAVEKSITVNGTDTASVAFDNYYDVVKPGSVEILGSKSYVDAVTGVAKDTQPGMFTFQLTGHGQNQTVSNDADGNFRFQIDYTKADIGKTYTYTVSEVKGDKNYITYDPASFQIHVKVEDDNEGGLKITKQLGETTVEDLSVAFRNTYNTVSGGSVAVSGVKTYTDGRTQYAKPIQAGMFSFNISGNGVDETVTCDENGNFHFSALTFDATDRGNTYTYTIKEVKGDKDYISYDDKEYTLKVTVEDNGQGGLTITKTLDGAAVDTVGVSFHNTYNIISGGEVEVSGIKTYIDDTTRNSKAVPAGMFSFKITDHNGYAETVTNAADGTFAFTSLKYDADDIGKEFTYTIEEVKGDNVHVTYDNTKHTLVVFVTDNGQGGLTITKLLNGEAVDAVAVAFRNLYHAPDDEVEKDVFLASKPDISIDGEKVNVGDTLLYKVTYLNANDEAATVQITDVIPAHTAYVDGSASDNGVFADGKLVWTLDLAAGESKTVSFQVKVSDPDVFIDNQAVAFDGVNQITTNVVSNHTYEEVDSKDVALAEKPEISIDGKLVQVGQTLVYTIDYTNITESPVDVTITDQIPAHTKLVDDGKGEEKDGVITWQIKNIKPREKVTVSFQVEVTEPGEIIENRAQIFDGSNKVTNLVTNSTPEKTVDKQTASTGEVLTYTLTYKNVTGAPAKLVITDKLSDALAFVEGSAGEGVYANGTITWTFDNVPADGEIVVTFQAKIKADTDADSALNRAQFVENGAETVFTNETETEVRKPELSLKKQTSVGGSKATNKVLTVEDGDEITYILTLTNSGEGDAYGITVADKIPEGLQFVSAQSGGRVKDGVVVWELAELKAGASVELTFKVKTPVVTESTTWTNVAAFTYANNPNGEDDVTESNDVETDQPAPETPDTGDHFHAAVFISLMVLSAFGIAAVAVAKKRDEENTL